jgi:hypothetical protein
MWSVPRCYKQGANLFVSSVKFCTGVCEDRTKASEAEESQLLEAISRERLMKTQQAGKRLSGCRGYFQSVEISDSPVITCSSELRYKWSINQFNNPHSIYSHTHKS